MNKINNIVYRNINRNIFLNLVQGIYYDKIPKIPTLYLLCRYNSEN